MIILSFLVIVRVLDNENVVQGFNRDVNLIPFLVRVGVYIYFISRHFPQAYREVRQKSLHSCQSEKVIYKISFISMIFVCICVIVGFDVDPRLAGFMNVVC